MPSRETLRLHADLLDRMTTKLSIDLEQSAICGDVSIDQISDAVLRCAECSNPDHCRGLLAKSQLLDRTPEYCRNRGLLEKLLP